MDTTKTCANCSHCTSIPVGENGFECCKLICDIFRHSPVYRIGGDKFVAVLKDSDHEYRGALIAELEKQMADNPDMNLAGGASDEPAEPAAPATPADYTNNSDPIDSPAATGPKPAEDKKPAETAGFVDGDIANESDSADGEHSDEPPVVAANVVTAPGAKKSNKSLFMILGGVGALAVIVVLIIVIMSL